MESLTFKYFPFVNSTRTPVHYTNYNKYSCIDTTVNIIGMVYTYLKCRGFGYPIYSQV